MRRLAVVLLLACVPARSWDRPDITNPGFQDRANGRAV